MSNSLLSTQCWHWLTCCSLQAVMSNSLLGTQCWHWVTCCSLLASLVTAHCHITLTLQETILFSSHSLLFGNIFITVACKILIEIHWLYIHIWEQIVKPSSELATFGLVKVLPSRANGKLTVYLCIQCKYKSSLTGYICYNNAVYM